MPEKMKKPPSISVVMPVYNCDRYLKESIESILSQTFEDFEFIIINDGSTDSTAEILRSYARKDSRIEIINQPNSGIVKALNRGICESKGNWVCRMDGDDIALPYRFARQIEKIRENPSIVILGGWCQLVDSQGISGKIYKYPTQNMELINNLETDKAFFPHSSVCFKNNIVKDLGGYRERFRHAEDLDLWLRLVGKGDFGCCEEMILKLRKHDSNILNSYAHLSQLRSIATRVCYLRRKIGLSDPSRLKEDKWRIFIRWIEKRMKEEKYFQFKQYWQNLRKLLYENNKASRMVKIRILLNELQNNSLHRKMYWEYRQKNKLVLRLVEESKIFWQD